jgi:signal transduction histidine kinase
MNDEKKHISLVNQFFLTLIAVAFLSVIIFSLFLIERVLVDYHSEVKNLKKSYSENKKLEIKNKILQIKDNIEWNINNPHAPILRIIEKNSNSLNFKVPENYTGPVSQLLNSICDSLAKSNLPVFITDSNGKHLCSFNPWNDSLPDDEILFEKEALLHHLIQSGRTDLCTLYDQNAERDSVIRAIVYCSSDLIPGYKVISIITKNHFGDLLKEFVLDSISQIRFAANEYVFVNTYDGLALITHGKYNNPPVEIYKTRDTAWIKTFEVQRTATRQQEGVYLTYNWQKLASPDTSAKTSYFSYIPDWGWIIGTGFYSDDVQELISEKKKVLKGEVVNALMNILFYLIITLVLCYFMIRFFSKRIRNNIKIFQDFFEKSASDTTFIDINNVNYQEFVFLAEYANMMAERRKITEAAIHELTSKLEQKVEERTRQFEISNKALESFSYSVSHDLRAPLRAVVGFSQILSTRHRASLNDEGRQYMDFIVEAGTRMEHLISDLLNYSRLGRRPVDLQLVPMSELFGSIHMIFKDQLDAIDAQFNFDKNLPKIVGDKTLLHQIMNNLISNAILYRKKNVPLVIDIGCNIKSDCIIINVTDNGIGISEEFWLKIFDVFQRLHNDETYPGTGIGLASVKKAVLLLGGSVWVESVVGEGSTFFVNLPLNS